MEEIAALKLAIEIVHVPWRVKLLRSEPLPDGVTLILRIASGEARAVSSAANLVDRPPHTIRKAAAFFIEQMLLFPEADSYRALGASPDISNENLRRNMAWLMAWLHPDHTRDEAHSTLAVRVSKAWNDLKTPERRAAYDRQLRAAARPQRGLLATPSRSRGLAKNALPARPRMRGLSRALSWVIGRRSP